ncbi:hypothetical protein DEU56DRAFT_737875, partial [Suillus clintonianus]|uniref:uncharacterized protein n=1 Tax=Suillus clintonianus TaxID=1904413 RepID=UPI001B868C47
RGQRPDPHEAVQLAAAIQFSGFRSVIASMWFIDDDVWSDSLNFYDNLVDVSGRLD